MELHQMTIHELRSLLRKREVSSEELTRSLLERIETVEAKVKAYMRPTPELALAQAKAVDEEIAKGNSLPPLAGIPLAIKDVICTQGIATTCSSRILENYIPPYDATVISRLRKERAVFLGKTNMDEFAMGSSTENSGFFTTRNPWGLDRVPGGSSGGSAAAVAAGEAIAALGSDTGGSIRQPASFCGVSGMKPTYGRVSRYGLVAFASSLDQIGPLARDAEDCALLLNAICGHDPRDSTSVDLEVPNFIQGLLPELRGFRLGIPQEYFVKGMDPEVEAAVRKAIETLKDLGAVCEEVSLPHSEYAVAVYYLVATAEASSNLARYDGVKYGYRTKKSSDLLDMYRFTRAEGFGAEVKRRIMLGTYALSSGYYDAYYLKAQKVRTLIREDFERAFQLFDALITPTAPTAAFRIGEKVDDPLQMYLSDIFTIPCNLAGLPGISIPCGFNREGLPIGLQILGKPFDEGKVLRVAHAFQHATEWHQRRPLL
ncbi:MAG: Asp-tRNA(Asn)/Glu-tRNA(Gln) amidotransferase subunit GatA [candidate division NC10 bacterium]|nr:Asp-tRNA(Asn)/Glu-tRNA(Gln) amidotransferase subunit GatA [candidate division NC10 bacterium]